MRNEALCKELYERYKDRLVDDHREDARDWPLSGWECFLMEEMLQEYLQNN